VISSVATSTDKSRDRLVVWDSTAVDQGKWQAMQAGKTLANSRVRCRIELTALQITKELVQSIVATLLRFVRCLMAGLRAHGVIDVSI
jgi:hypothetical protein